MSQLGAVVARTLMWANASLVEMEQADCGLSGMLRFMGSRPRQGLNAHFLALLWEKPRQPEAQYGEGTGNSP